MVNVKKTRALYMDHYDPAPKPFAAYSALGEGVSLGFDQKSRMRVMAATEVLYGADDASIVLRADHRSPEDWMALEIDVKAEISALLVTLRYAPAERVYLSAIGKAGKHEMRIDLDEYRLGSDMTRLAFGIEAIREQFTFAVDEIRMMLLFPARPWFALALHEIEER